MTRPTIAVVGMAETDRTTVLAQEALLLVLGSYPPAVDEDALGVVKSLMDDWTSTAELDPIWNAISIAPDFNADAVRASFARLKSWEARLSTEIRLPKGMLALASSDLQELATQRQVDPQGLARLLRGGAASTRIRQLPPAGPGAGAIKQPAAPGKPAARRNLARRRMLGIASAVVTVGCLVFIGLYLWGLRGGRSWNSVAPEFAEGIPLTGARQAGIEVAGTLADDSWLSTDEATRKDQMKDALRELPAGVQVFFVRDQKGAIRATARWFGKPRDIDVQLR